MLGDWKRACALRTLVDSALAGSHALASFFSAPMSLDDSGSVITSTITQKPNTTHLVQLPAGISASFLTPFIDSPYGSAVGLTSSGTELSTATIRASGNCAMSLTLRTRS